MERWKRGGDSRGVRHAISYALEGRCDAHLPHSAVVEVLENYSGTGGSTVARFVVEDGVVSSDELSAGGLRVWLTGHDPVTGEQRGTSLMRPDADLLLDGTLITPSRTASPHCCILIWRQNSRRFRTASATAS